MISRCRDRTGRWRESKHALRQRTGAGVDGRIGLKL